jgi:formylmethanofuran dehydrogenase subunit B
MADQAPLTSNVARAQAAANALPSAAPPAGTRTVADSVCLGCGCLCDDIDVQVTTDDAGHQQIVAADRACEIGLRWFGVGQSRVPATQACRIAGQPATFDEAINRAAEILVAAQAPLVCGLSESPTAGVRVALHLAEQIGAVVDSATSWLYAPAILATQAVGEVTCTWGEIAQRCDLVVFWGADPATYQPRHFERFSLDPRSEFLPGGRNDRYVVVVDETRSHTSEVANEFLELRNGGDFDALWTLRALVRGLVVDAASVEFSTGVELQAWRALVERMKNARYGAILFGSRLGLSWRPHLSFEALQLLAQELNDYTRFVSHGLGSGENTAGCDEVFTWTTGYPFAVDFQRGYPRYLPEENSAEVRLIRGEVDAVLTVFDDAFDMMPKDARATLERLPVIAIDCRENETMERATVAFRTGQPGVATGGTVYRSDGVPLALRPAITATEPTEAEVLAALSRRVSELQNSGDTASPQNTAEQKKAPS